MCIGALSRAPLLTPRLAVGSGAAVAPRGEADHGDVVFDSLGGGGRGAAGGGLRPSARRRRRAGRVGLYHAWPHEDAVPRRALEIRDALSTEISIKRYTCSILI